ncbi:MAG: hypothetical protein Q8K89_12805 [Actinomycetota bacterium]|nr:hypothetical protein [Actinomycetota bacterium]
MGDAIEQTEQLHEPEGQPITEPAEEPQAEPEAEPAPEAEAEAEAEPEPQAEPEAAIEPEPEPEEPALQKPRSLVPWWPFWLLTVAWVALCGSAAYFLTRDPLLSPLRQESYLFVVAAGLALTVMGPVLAIVVWATSRAGVAEQGRQGMFVSSLIRSATITFVGVLAWIGTLILVDALRLGLIRF